MEALMFNFVYTSYKGMLIKLEFFVLLKFYFWCSLSEGYSEPCQTSKMEHFAKIVNDFKA